MRLIADIAPDTKQRENCAHHVTTYRTTNRET